MIQPKVIIQVPGFQGPPGADGKPGRDGRGVPDYTGQTDAVLKTDGKKTFWAHDTSSTYIHTQAILSNVWIINHKLGKFPSVTIVDSAGTKFYGDVNYVDANTCVVTFNSAILGTAYLN